MSRLNTDTQTHRHVNIELEFCETEFAIINIIIIIIARVFHLQDIKNLNYIFYPPRQHTTPTNFETDATKNLISNAQQHDHHARSFDLKYKQTHNKKNIATGETSQVITSRHFSSLLFTSLDYFHFFDNFTSLTISLL